MSDEISLFSLIHWSALHLLIPLVAVQRLLELRRARSNAAVLLGRGAVEAGGEEYPRIVALHVLWFIGMIGEIVFLSREVVPLWPLLLLVFLVAQAVRLWAIRTLGVRWNTRILLVPGSRPVVKGPYRYLRHPNYVAVVVELLVLPLMLGCYVTALTVTFINLYLLRRRIAVEEEALLTIGKGYEKVGRVSGRTESTGTSK